MMEWYFAQMNVSEPGVARVRGGSIDARHAARSTHAGSRFPPFGNSFETFWTSFVKCHRLLSRAKLECRTFSTFCRRVAYSLSMKWHLQVSCHITSWNGLSYHTIDKYQMIKLRRYHDPIKRRRHNRFYRDRRLSLKWPPLTFRLYNRQSRLLGAEWSVRERAER